MTDLNMVGASFKDRERELVVVTTVTPWDEVPRVRHQVTRQLARFYNVLYVQLPFGSLCKHDRIRQVGDRLLVFETARLIRGLGRVWHSVSIFHKHYNISLLRKIESAIDGLHYSRAALVNFQCNFAEIMLSEMFASKIYLCNDDFSANVAGPGQRARVIKYESEVASSADICLAVSTPLVWKLEKINPNVELFLPGHELESIPEAMRLASDRDAKRIRACYMGYVNDRIRFDWLKAMLQDQAIALTLIGPVESEEALESLSEFGNLTVLGPKQGQVLQELLTEQDVFVLPYNVENESVRVLTAPNKLFQYVACGRPIVVSDLPHFVNLPDKFLYRASSAEEFVEAVHRAYLEDSDDTACVRVEYAAENSWDVRGVRLRIALESITRRKRDSRFDFVETVERQW